jgi:hypothetical protein
MIFHNVEFILHLFFLVFVKNSLACQSSCVLEGPEEIH